MRANEPNYAALRRALSRRRAELGLTYDMLAERSGLSRTGVINLETGNRIGSLATWYAVAHGLDTTASALLMHLEEPTQIGL
ncbi:helix-turn-helix transcriptional regulator [Cryobacterium sp. PAMC25264]|uniref:helix-turn-helix transcriptional regulator n=1 Tax=Cryobacterium sp. PAMC25264 TaxID=2861288 RepID=UPI001C637960|nr:helix-turn-helix transcriptional regulator [Cryobacterium sp. PAMC25264]